MRLLRRAPGQQAARHGGHWRQAIMGGFVVSLSAGLAAQMPAPGTCACSSSTCSSSHGGIGKFSISPALSSPNTPQRLELSPGRMGWSSNRQNHPERPLWPREIISPRPRHRAPVGALPPSPKQRDKAVPLGKGTKPPCQAGNCRGLEAPAGGACPLAAQTPLDQWLKFTNIDFSITNIAMPLRVPMTKVRLLGGTLRPSLQPASCQC
jgi:hypothetical protein